MLFTEAGKLILNGVLKLHVQEQPGIHQTGEGRTSPTRH